MIINYNGRVVLIKRRDGSYALPGGFVEYGETTDSAAVREAKEETNLDIKLEKIIGVYSDPKRDPRMHVMSITYAATGSGKLKSGDDAKEAFVVSVEDAMKMKLAFDHNKILGDYNEYLKLRENLASLEHEQWMHWSKEKGEIELQHLYVPYTQLPEEKKEQDRVWADKVLKLLGAIKK
ncbi:MAG: NUDIX hydrolase [archaeon]